MPPAKYDRAAIIRFWHAVELLSPQTVPKAKKERESHYEPLVLDISRYGGLVLPWSPLSPVASTEIPQGRIWSHQVFAHCFDYRQIIELLEKKFGADNGYRDTRENIVGLFALRFTPQGEMVPDSFVLSSAAWLAGRIIKGEGWLSGFEEAQATAAEIASETLEGSVTPESLERLSDRIVSLLALDSFFAPSAKRYISRSVPVRPNDPEPADDPLNSFLLDDLASVADSVATGTSSSALNLYLHRHEGRTRIDLSADTTSASQCHLLSPARYPAGCWPTPGNLGLVHSQQFAVNALRDGLLPRGGLLSVNGPPGTGKTTLLRDIVAAVVTDRADALAQLAKPADAFLARGTVVDADKNRGFWSLRSSLLGHEIVVASSNNGAIENVTLELPQRDKVDASWLEEYDQFSEIASLVSGQPAWGLISAALGNKGNRASFMKAFWGGVAKRKSKKAASSQEEQPEEADSGADEPDDEVSLQAKDASQAAGTFPDSVPAQVVPADENTPSADAGDQPKQPPPPPKGMEAWLNDQPKQFAPGEKERLWREAVQRYQDAKRTAIQAGVDAQRIFDLNAERRELSKTLRPLGQAALDAVIAMEEHDKVIAAKAAEIADVEVLLETAVAAVAELLKRRPGFFANLLSFGRAGRRWAQEEENVRAQRELAQGRGRRLQREMTDLEQQLQHQMATYEKARATAERAKQQVQQLTREVMALADKYHAHHLKVYLETGVIGRGAEIELAEPWTIPGWRQARSRVFLEALRLHKTLFQLESKKVFTNLSLAKVVLEGERYQNMPPEAIRSVWGTLFMAVPVLSSTFASFGRCFSTLGAGDIGWLLVDEAGQATPQAAVGALWRSKRAVMVGDPLQLEPIITVPPAALEHMRTAFGVDLHWMPQQLSAQRLADMANLFGRKVGPQGAEEWVGLPLVVHRRCDRPMFEIANRIAYNGAMVYGTAKKVPDTPATLPTGWVQVRGPSSGNWVPAEGRALNLLISLLTLEGVAPEDISVITPFSDVDRQVRRSSIARAGGTSGTIHTMQGRESAVVVLVLGGEADPQRPGARGWVVEKPNMLNVAATRAKRRLYVIGDRADWAKRRYFEQIMDLLPVVNVEAALARMKESLQAEPGYDGAEAAYEQWSMLESNQLRIGRPAPAGPGTSERPESDKLRVGLPAPGEPGASDRPLP